MVDFYDKNIENLANLRADVMRQYKRMQAFFKNKNAQDYHIPKNEWEQFNQQITFHVKSYMHNYQPSI